jgi:hypothetical protein
LIAVMAAADAADADVLAKDWTVEEVAAALRLSPGSARNRLAVARFVVGQAGLLALLRAGAVTLLHVVVAQRELRHCTREQTGQVLAGVAARAAGWTVGEFARALRRGVARVAAGDAQRRHAAARAERDVTIRPAEDGMADLWARLSAVEAAAIAASLDTAAHRYLPGDTRTVAQRRADTLVTRLLNTDSATGTGNGSGDGSPGGSGSGVGGGGAGLAPQVFIAASTLAGLDEQPAELGGYGPIPAALARAIAADPTGTWRGVLTDNHGQILDYGRRVYRPPAALDRLVRLRDRTCRFPGCTHPARSADLDHITDHHHGGATTATNLHALCRRHHHLTHDTRWSVHRDDTGTTIWTSPAGRTYHVPPTTYPTTAPGKDSAGPDPPPS